jgi:hypothetical protein
MHKMERNFEANASRHQGLNQGFFCDVAGTETGGSTMAETLSKGILVAAGAVAVQANSIWLVSGATVILNFLKKSMPEWDLPLRLARIWLRTACPETGRFWKRNPKRGLVGHLLP